MAKATFNAFMGGLSGTTGTAVFVRQPDGSVIVRVRSAPFDPNTALQQETRSRMRAAKRFYRLLNQTQAKAWNDYAQRVAGPGKVKRAYDIFLSLSLRYMAVHGEASVPLMPPANEYVGDSVVVEASADATSVTFSALSANGDDTITECLLAPTRSYISFPNENAFRHGTFFQFPTGGGSVSVPRFRGRYAVAVRFVRTSTGQSSPLVRIGVVDVG
jgi:hypothetical protein